MQGKNRRKSREQYWIVIYIQYVSWWINFRNISELDMVLQMEKKIITATFLEPWIREEQGSTPVYRKSENYFGGYYRKDAR